MTELITDELPETCSDCGFHNYITDPDGPDIHYCKACEYLGLDDEMGDHNSEFDKNYIKVRDSRCPLMLKGYVPSNLALKIVNLLLSVTGEDRANLNELEKRVTESEKTIEELKFKIEKLYEIFREVKK